MLDVNTIVQSDVMEYLKSLPDGAVNCIVTSPPYYGLRDYQVAGQLGLEPTLAEYIDKLTGVFREARRVLREDGTLWLNMGDSYASVWASGRRSVIGAPSRTNRFIAMPEGLKEKDLCGQPWRLAFALQDDGWWLRSDIIWHKRNPMPESVTDRPTKSHEYVFLMTKAANYWYDAEAIREPAEYGRRDWSDIESVLASATKGNDRRPQHGIRTKASVTGSNSSAGRNKRTVWTVATHSFADAHFATFPPKLIEPMVLAGCPPKVCAKCGMPWERVVEYHRNGKDWNRNNRNGGDRLAIGQSASDSMSESYLPPTTLGWRATCECNGDTVAGIVLDPFMGSGTTALVATQLGRRWLGCELSADYVAMANKRLAKQTIPMFSSEEVETFTAPMFPEPTEPTPEQAALFGEDEE